MDAERWALLKSTFQEALDLPPAGRETWLRTRCGADSELYDRLRALLAAHETGSDLFEGRGQEAVEELRADLQVAVEGFRLGPYRVLSELGRGGMGAVYLAVRDDETFEARVAIKLVKRGMDTDEIVRRFVNERQILADLVHPNIARLLDGGTSSDGRPFFVMEHIEGRPITEYARTEGLGVEAQLELFLQVAAAVQFAHQNLIVHRDLKPANILVGSDGVPKLLDFGIAKLLGVDETQRYAPTLIQGAPPMTPDYASPEQRAGGAVTTATDVYGLGLLLAELLTGLSPAAVERELGGGWRGKPPSQVVRELARRGEREARLARLLTGDLDTIVGKATEPEPARRYGTAAELAEDVRRHLDRLPVRARKPTLSYRFGRAVRRHKLATAFLASVVLFGAGAAYQAVELARQRDRVEGARQRAEAQRERAEALSRFMVDLFNVSSPEQNRGAVVTARELLDAGARRLSGEGGQTPEWLPDASGDIQGQPASRADLLHTIGKVYRRLGLLPEAEKALTRALDLRSGVAGTEAAFDRAATLTELAHVRSSGGDLGGAVGLYQQALDLERRRAGTVAPSLGETLNGLAMTLARRGEAKRAETILLEAAAHLRKSGARLELASCLNDLAVLAIDGERPREAGAWLDEAMAIHRELLGRDDPRGATDLSNLAGVLFRQGDYAAAEERFRQALELQRAVLGPEHPEVALALSNLATVQFERGRLAEAERSQRQALDLSRRVLPKDHPDLANALNNLAAILRERRDPVGAEALYEEALAIYRHLYGARHALIANTLNNLALARRDHGDLSSAERLIRQGLEMRRALLGREHPAVAGSLNTLGTVLRLEGRAKESETAFREALELRRRVLGADHPAIATTLVALGGLLLQAGRPSEAEPHLIEARSILSRATGGSWEVAANAEGTLGACYLTEGRLGEAQPLLASSHRAFLAHRGAGHPDVRMAEERLRRLAGQKTAGQKAAGRRP